MVIAHLKSNFINQGQQQWDDPARRPDFVKAALRNRRRIATEAMRVRQHLKRRLDADPDAAIVVLGDLNDGPGQDYFEALYLAHNVTDILLGSPTGPSGCSTTPKPTSPRPTATAPSLTTSSPTSPTSACCLTTSCSPPP